MDVIIHGLADPDQLIHILKESGERHVGYGVKDEYYQPVGSMLVQAIRETSGTSWNNEMSDAWNRLLTNVVKIMTSQ